MKFYLSSYKIGQEVEKLKNFMQGKRMGFIPNSVDYLELKSRQESNDKNMKDISDIGIDIEILDLRDYFGKMSQLEEKIKTLWGVWVRGGNTFILRQAMKLSGFDDIIQRMDRDDFVYGGYSAGICILAPSLVALQQVDNPHIMPYKELQEVIWDGLWLLDYIILPHYKSDHPESADIDKEVDYCTRNNIRYKTLSDGEVIVIQ